MAGVSASSSTTVESQSRVHGRIRLASIPLQQGVARARQTAQEAVAMGEASGNSYNTCLAERALERIAHRTGDVARSRGQLAARSRRLRRARRRRECAHTP